MRGVVLLQANHRHHSKFVWCSRRRHLMQFGKSMIFLILTKIFVSQFYFYTIRYVWMECALLTALRQWEPAYMATIWSREHQVACSRCPHSPWRAKTFSPMSYRSISRQKHTAAAQASPPPAATLVQVDFDYNLFLITWGQLVNWGFV